MTKCLSDEYSSGDPYKVNSSINSEFHKRRFDITVEYVLSAYSLIKNSQPKILDVGCGEGYITNEIKDLIPGAIMFGIDSSNIAVKTASEKFSSIKFDVGDALNLPYESSYFDIVICNNLLEHVSDPEKMLLEISSKLKKGGFLIISTPSPYRIENLIKFPIKRTLCLMSENHFKEYSIGDVKKMLSVRGYQVENFKSRPLNYSIKNIKKYFIHMILKPIVNSFFVFSPQLKAGLESTVFYLARKKY